MTSESVSASGVGGGGGGGVTTGVGTDFFFLHFFAADARECFFLQRFFAATAWPGLALLALVVANTIVSPRTAATARTLQRRAG
jgi:hypothetical protein